MVRIGDARRKGGLVVDLLEGTESGALMPSVSVEAFLAKRDAVRAHFVAVQEHLAAVQDILAAMGDTDEPRRDNWYVLRAATLEDVDRRVFLAPKDVDMVMARIDAHLWHKLLGLSGLVTLMDAKARCEWDKVVDSGKAPPLNAANVRSTFDALFATKGDMFERGVVNVFRRLSWDYKTNTPVMFGKRLVLTWICDNWNGIALRYESSRDLDDLRRVMCVLDGEPAPGANQSLYRVVGSDLTQGPVEVGPNVECRGDAYFSIKGFKNGNCHLTFLRQDLVDKMNRILAKHNPSALPAAR